MNNKKLSKKLERAAAKKFGGKPRIASGALPFAKGDFTACGKRILAEHKFTKKNSYSLRLEDIQKHAKHAVLEGKEWMWLVEFPDAKTQVVVLDANFLCELLDIE